LGGVWVYRGGGGVEENAKKIKGKKRKGANKLKLLSQITRELRMNTPTTKPRGIRVIAICVFRREESILVFAGYDSVKETYYYRPLGGGVEPGETTREAVAREIAEELGLQIDALKLLGVLENIFVLDGQPKHEIVFVYDGRFVDATIYDRQELHGWEANGEPLRATWRRLDSFEERHRLVPEGLESLLREGG
jgi:8-oxo-dGTP pyrophosphatase MutT (NUDIX family)